MKTITITQDQLEVLIAQSYSYGWHDGQDAILLNLKHIDKGGDALGKKHFENVVKVALEEMNLL
jgi:hypothetical protein